MEDEIDLRVYINTLIRYWWLIAALTVVAGVAAYVIGSRQPAVYEAGAYIAIVSTRSEIVFDPKFKTVSDAGAAAAANEARRNALVGLVKSSAIATEVIPKLTSILKPEEQNPANLIGAVDGSLVSKSDLIRIAAKSDDPQKAAEIVNAWAPEYVTQINELYGEKTGTLESVQAQTKQTQADYEQAEQALTDFTRNNRMAKLQLEITAIEKNIQSYRDAQAASQQAVYAQQLAAQQGLLAAYYAEYNQLDLLQGRTRVLRSQVAGSGGYKEADALAMLLLKTDLARSVSGSAPDGKPSGTTLQINVTPASVSPEAILTDLDAIIKSTDARKAEVKQTIDRLSASMINTTEQPVDLPANDPLVKKIAALNAEVLAMKGDLEAESARQRELTQQRDVAWNTYNTLVNKEIELKIAAQTQDSQVRLAALATPPTAPLATSKTRNALMAAAAGLMAGVVLTFVVEYLRQPQVQPATYPASHDV